jgi:hypothetical protein
MSSVEFDAQAASAVGAFGFESFEEKEDSKATHFNKAIFAPPFYPVQFSHKSALHHPTRESQKADAFMKDRLFAGSKQSIRENRAGASGSTDSEGNSTYEVHGSHGERTENGTVVEVGGYGQASSDKDGNNSWEVGGSIDIKW